MSENQLQTAFSSWKIYLAILLGLGISAWMMYSSLSHEQFIEVKAGDGTHVLIENKKTPDTNLQNFKEQEGGNYRLKTMYDVLYDIEWTSQSAFWLLMAFVFMIGRDVAYMIRIRILTQKQLSWRASFRTIMLWEFASALSPGVVGGSAVAMFILNREKIPLGRSTAIVVITAMMDNLFYVLMIPFVLIFISIQDLFPMNSSLDSGIAYTFWIGFAVIATLCLFLFLSIFRFPSLITKTLGLIFSLPFLRKWKQNVRKTGEEIEITSAELKKEPIQFWLSSFGATILSWTSRYLVINCILAAFIQISFFDHFFILGKQLVLWLFMLISPTPGASGVAEYAFAELLANFSSSALLLSGLALLWRLISYFPYLIIGAIMLPRWLKSA
jgi:uncharacterized protein (TIRG00374 family)